MSMISEASFTSIFSSFDYNLKKVGEPWGWPLMKGRFSKEVITPTLQDPETKLRILTADEKPIGYALIIGADEGLSDKFWSAANRNKIVEILTIGLYPNECGRGRGWSFFEMQFQDLFKGYDTVYWSSSGSNHPGLAAFYERMGVEVLPRELVPDPRIMPVLVPGELKQALA